MSEIAYTFRDHLAEWLWYVRWALRTRCKDMSSVPCKDRLGYHTVVWCRRRRWHRGEHEYAP